MLFLLLFFVFALLYVFVCLFVWFVVVFLILKLVTRKLAETSQATKSEEKRMFSQASFLVTNSQANRTSTHTHTLQGKVSAVDTNREVDTWCHHQQKNGGCM